MTLVITVVSHRGLWQVSDQRPRIGGRFFDHVSMKHIRLEAQNGKAIIAYAGLGMVGDMLISEWIRKLLRGSKRPLDEYLGVLKEASDRKLTPFCRKSKTPHTFSIAAFRDGCPTLYLITNRLRKDGREYIGDEFGFQRLNLGNSTSAMIGNAEGSGVKALPAPDAIENMIRGTIRRRAKKPSLSDDMMAVLARLNRDASQDPRCDGTVSPHCMFTFLGSPEAGFRIESYGRSARSFFYGRRARSFRIWSEITPIFRNLEGYDASGIPHRLLDLERRDIERLFKGEEPTPNTDIDELNEALRKRDFSPTDKL